VDGDEKGHYILKMGVEKAIKEMKDKKATGNNDVLEDALSFVERR
jgi:hypothetical protein